MFRFLQVFSLVAVLLVSSFSSAVQCSAFLKSKAPLHSEKLVKSYIMFNLMFPQFDSGIIYGSLGLILTGQTDLPGLKKAAFSGANTDYFFKIMVNAHKAHGADPEGLITPDRIDRLGVRLDQVLELFLFNTYKMLLPEVDLPPVRLRDQVPGQLQQLQLYIDSSPSVSTRLQEYGKTILNVLYSEEIKKQSKEYRAQFKWLIEIGEDPRGNFARMIALEMHSSLRLAVSQALKENHPELRATAQLPLDPQAPKPIADLIGR